MKETISVESKVAISLQSLGTPNTLCYVEEVYGVVESTIPKLLTKFYRLVRVHLQQYFIQYFKSNSV